jgi:hypothetical protein
MSHFADKRVIRKVALEDAKKQQALNPIMRGVSWLEKKKSTRIAIAPGKRKDGKKNGIMQLADEALPSVLLTSKSLTSKIADEIKRHHRWLGVVYYFSKRFPRVLRVVSLATNIIVMLFIQSITYNLTNGDDGSCERLQDEVDCLAPRSAYATGASRCYWRH